VATRQGAWAVAGCADTALSYGALAARAQRDDRTVTSRLRGRR
jgi:hypothetical protein